MILKLHMDASYLSESQSRNRAGVFFYVGGATNNISQPNVAIMVISTITCNVMSSAAEAEYGALFYNAK